MDGWKPGSHEPSWTWTNEIDEQVNRSEMNEMLRSVKEEGVKDPVLLGSDGRVWDGHYRIIAAMLLHRSVPVEYA
jgi:ParB-like chromosome segregation protein Spo0J